MSGPAPAAADDAAFRVSVAADRCVGAGQCVLTAPAVFDQDADGISRVLKPDVASAEADAVREAEFLCPGQAIAVTQPAPDRSRLAGSS